MPAVSDTTRTLTYSELSERSISIAAAISRHGVRTGDAVVVAQERTTDAIATVLGLACVGAAYVPVDPSEPELRIRRILDGAGAACAVVDALGLEQLAAVDVPILDVSAITSSVDVAPVHAELAYILYTSGSTGIPKGVEVTQENVLSLLAGSTAWADVQPTDVWASFHAFTFDISIWEIWGSLTTGGHLVLLPRSAQRDVAHLDQLLRQFRIAHLCQTPTALRWFGAHVGRHGIPPDLRSLFICGERLDFHTLEPFQSKIAANALHAWNLYGPTEATVYALGHRITVDEISSDRSVIGKPLPHIDVKLEQRADSFELLLGGEGVARGYRGDPDLTSERFPVIEGSRWYRTGDIVRKLENQELEFLGREGGFVKVRGYRVEPDEVVAALCAHSSVADAGVCVLEVRGYESLVAAVVLHEGEAFEDSELRRHTASLLPEYMRPSRIVPIARLPRLPSAKLDRVALAEVVSDRLSNP